MIKLTDLLQEEYPGNGKLSKDSFHKGKSKSGLDWEADKDNPKEDIAKLENAETTEELVEGLYEDEEGIDERQLKSYIMAIHKMAAELYNVLDDTDDPEEWVMEKAKQCSNLMNAVHGHVTYAKKATRETTLDQEPRDRMRERGY